jgi:cardiolipin synthase
MNRAEKTDRFVSETAKYIQSACGLPLSTAGECTYFHSGEKYFESIKEKLRTAERFVFLEFYIISQGKLWDELYELLKACAKRGADVRIIYDDFGCLKELPEKFGKKCGEAGIKLLCFNRMRPFLDVAQNNRTHRKIVIIDGVYAFTGGANIADEYVNAIVKFGHWKDTGVMITGEAVKNFTRMFLSSWNARFGDEDTAAFLPSNTTLQDAVGDTICLPFYDAPDSHRTVCEDIYLKIIYNARDYIYINTPYFIIDGKIVDALGSAARSGVDVRITIPHIPDSKAVFALTKAFCNQLLAAGVKIYEYTPGFIHAKSIVSDDKYCVIGTSNMDFRSFYLHHECDIFIYKGICAALRADYETTCTECLQNFPAEQKLPLSTRLMQSLLRLLAPLM